MALLLASAASSQDGKASKKLPEPEQASLVRAEKTIRELFKAEYLKDRPTERRYLATKLFIQALDTKDDPPARFVLYREASTVAAKAGEFGIALAALEKLGREFETDAAPLKVAALQTAAGSTSATKQKNLTEAAIEIYYEVIGENEPKVAGDLLAIAETAAKRAKNSSLVAKVEARKTELADILQEFEKYRTALVKVETKSDDPDANQIVGKYLCFIKGDWKTGLPYMAKCGDELLKTLATRDVSNPSDADAQVYLADGWWELAETLNPAAKRHVMLRAASWYDNASTKLTGLTQTKAKQRIAATGKQFPHKEPFWLRDDIPVELRNKLRTLGEATKAGGLAKKVDVSAFVGRWKIVNDKGVVAMYVTVSSSFTAKRDHAPDSPGKWEVVGADARIAWEDGFRDVMRLEDGKIALLVLGKASSWDVQAMHRLQAVRIADKK
jgi:hypothetical protein